jgi:hypothetical protein
MSAEWELEHLGQNISELEFLNQQPQGTPVQSLEEEGRQP